MYRCRLHWVAVIEALILAKVIMIGRVLRLGRGLEQKPLIYPILYKTVVFTVFVAVFTLIEHALKGLLKGQGLMGGLVAYFEKGPHEFLAGSVMLFVAFIPFFGVRELGRVLGEEKIQDLLFRKRADQGSRDRVQEAYDDERGQARHNPERSGGPAGTSEVPQELAPGGPAT